MKRASVVWMLVAGAFALSGVCADDLRLRVADVFYAGDVVLDGGTLAFDAMRKCAGAATNRVAGRLRVEGVFSACVEQAPTRNGRVFAARRVDGADVRLSFLKGALRVDGAAVVWDVSADDGFQAAKTGCGFRCTADGTPFLIGLDGVSVSAATGWRLTPHPKSPGDYVLVDFSWQSVPPASTPQNLKMNADRKIPFLRPLPTLAKDSSVNNNPEWAMPGVFTDAGRDLGFFMKKLRDTVSMNRRLIRIDGRTVVCNHNWIRDHVHQMKGWCHWERDCTSFLDVLLDHPRADGMLYELIKQIDDGHWCMVDDSSRLLFPEDHMAMARLDLEADVEYLAVEGAHRYWRMLGDDAWMARRLPVLERAINWQTSDPQHWNADVGLCIRPFTIDTWDFVPTGATGPDRRIHPWEPLPAMHGDNTGVYQAMRQLAAMNRHLGRAAKAADWEARAETLKANIFRHLWNGRYFIHQKFFNGEQGLDDKEDVRLSLSDAYALNRGILTGDQCRSIVDEYQARRKTTTAFAEWFSIDPPYAPTFAYHAAGTYVNGAISPFTAGELARGAFDCGREAYAWDILERFMRKVKADGEVYFLYNPKDGASISASIGPSAWGAAALLNALDEGLAGVVNAGFGYDELAFSPRWPVTPYTNVRYLTGYEAFGRTIDYRHVRTDAGMRYRVESPAKTIRAHLLLPVGKTPRTLRVNGAERAFSVSHVDASRYLDVVVEPVAGLADFEVLWD